MTKSPLRLSFFWHMHQPDYRNSRGVMTMPWVFLHAIKDYYEMPWLLSRATGLKATFNITAPLIEQLDLYDDPLKNDYFLSLWSEHPSRLEESARTWMIKTCKSTQYETMIKPIATFDRLYHKEDLSDEELIDFEVLFVLAWCGNYLRQNNTLVKTLFKREKGFSQEDKMDLLESLRLFVSTILPFYKELQDKGVISLATTPYNHPILPLLLDINNATRANEHAVLPNNPISLEEDANEQIKRAIILYEERFGRRPSGFWPAEGAVDEVSVTLYKSHGIGWIATDEAILFRSLKSEERKDLYRSYDYNGVTIGFRDHGLSDLLGFTYRFKSGHDAVEHFMSSLEPIAQEMDDPTVFVILDGENAWEFFENNAYEFFTTLYARLLKTSWCQTVTMDEVSSQKDSRPLKTLAAGSWIQGDFGTWCGDSEKNRAWELIYQTKRDVNNYTETISKELEEKIRFHFLAAECSDWFWWYGDDHVTEFAIEFDELFREHLITIYRLLEIQPPSDLFEPILSHKSSASFFLRPQESITPLIDGKNGSFFEWIGSGSIDESKLYSTMDKVRGPIEKIYYGHNKTDVFLAFEGKITTLDRAGLQLQVTLEELNEVVTFDMDKVYDDKDRRLAIDERIELSLSRDYFQGHCAMHLRFEIIKGRKIVQTLPGFGSLLIELDETYGNNWFV